MMQSKTVLGNQMICYIFVYINLCNYICISQILERTELVSVLASSAVIVGLSPGRVKPKNIKLVFVASPLSTQH